MGNVCVFQTVLQLLNHYNLMTTLQAGHRTLNNAANNGTFLEELEILFRECDIDFDHLDRWIMCFPHVINICCQHIIAKFTNVNLIDLAHVAELPLAADGQSFDDAVSSNPIACGRNIVHVLRSSGQHHERLKEVIVDGNAKGWFVAGGIEVMVPPCQLLRDIKTQWDSVYFMIRCLCKMQLVSQYFPAWIAISWFNDQAIDHFLALPINNDLAMHRMTFMQWSVLADFQVILEVQPSSGALPIGAIWQPVQIPHKVQVIMSFETTLVLSGTIPAFEMFMSSWE